MKALGGLLMTLLACSSPISLSVTQTVPGAIGVGLTEQFDIVEYEGECCLKESDDPTERHLTATVVGDGVMVSQISAVTYFGSTERVVGHFTFTATGIAEGSSTIEIRGDNDVVTDRVDVVSESVASSSFALLAADQAYPAPFEVFENFEPKTGEDWSFTLQATYIDANDVALAGGAAAVLTTTDPELVCYYCGPFGYQLIAGTIPGHGTIATVGSTAAIDIVDSNAIVDFSIDDPQPLNLKVHQDRMFLLKPVDAGGHPLIGLEAYEATVTSADGDIASGYADTAYGFQSFHLVGNKVGTTTVYVGMDNAEHSYVVTVHD